MLEDIRARQNADNAQHRQNIGSLDTLVTKKLETMQNYIKGSLDAIYAEITNNRQLPTQGQPQTNWSFNSADRSPAGNGPMDLSAQSRFNDRITASQAASPVTTTGNRRENIHNQTMTLGPSNTTATGGSLKLEAPIFKGTTSELPMQFLSNLRAYRDAYVPRYHFKLIITQCMSDIARSWWNITRDDVRDWGQFETEFRRRFWSEEIQNNIKMKLDYYWYDATKKQSRMGYALKMIGMARDLVPTPTENEIIHKIKRHFSEDVRTTIRTLGITTIPRLLDLLSSYDEEGPGNRERARPTTREAYRAPTNNEDSSNKTSHQQNYYNKSTQNNYNKNTQSNSNKTTPNNNMQKNSIREEKNFSQRKIQAIIKEEGESEDLEIITEESEASGNEEASPSET